MKNEWINWVKYAVHCVLVLMFGVVLSGCKSTNVKTPVMVTEQLPINTGKPHISGMVDLGGLDIPLDGQIPQNMSDKRFSPGEWVMLQGKNLGATQVSIDGKLAPVTKYFRNQPLFQIPVGLLPRKEHQLQLVQEKGNASYSFATTHYIVATDTDDKAIHLIRTNVKEEGGIEEEWLKLESEFKRPLFNLVSRDSRFLFCVNIKDDAQRTVLPHQKSYLLEVATYHLAAPESPKLIASMDVYIESALTDVSLGEDNQLMLLGRQSLIILDTHDPLKLKLKGHLILPDNVKDKEHTYYGDAVFLNGGKQVVALEVQNNTVTLIDVSLSDKFVVTDSLPVMPDKVLPFSVDLEADPKVPGQFWILQAPNYRLIDSQFFSNLYKRYIVREEKLPEKQPVYRLQKMQIKDTKLQMGSALPLPADYAAYFASFGQDGRIYVTTTKMNFFTSDFLNKSNKEMLSAAKSILWDSISLGRVIAVDPQSGAVEKVASGVGIYYHLVDVPDIGPVFSLLKFGPSLSYPYMSPSWGVGVKSTGTYAKRKMDYHALFPPYSVGYISYQY